MTFLDYFIKARQAKYIRREKLSNGKWKYYYKDDNIKQKNENIISKRDLMNKESPIDEIEKKFHTGYRIQELNEKIPKHSVSSFSDDDNTYLKGVSAFPNFSNAMGDLILGERGSYGDNYSRDLSNPAIVLVYSKTSYQGEGLDDEVNLKEPKGLIRITKDDLQKYLIQNNYYYDSSKDLDEKDNFNYDKFYSNEKNIINFFIKRNLKLS